MRFRRQTCHSLTTHSPSQHTKRTYYRFKQLEKRVKDKSTLNIASNIANIPIESIDLSIKTILYKLSFVQNKTPNLLYTR